MSLEIIVKGVWGSTSLVLPLSHCSQWDENTYVYSILKYIIFTYEALLTQEKVMTL